MDTFKNFFKNRPVFDVTETITIDGIGDTMAKIDSGNEAFNVLHGIDIQVNDGIVTFKTINDRQLSLPLEDTIIINIGSGIKENRPVVTLNITIKGKHYKSTPFSLANRAENEEKVLVGVPFLKSVNALVDVVN